MGKEQWDRWRGEKETRRKKKKKEKEKNEKEEEIKSKTFIVHEVKNRKSSTYQGML